MTISQAYQHSSDSVRLIKNNGYRLGKKIGQSWALLQFWLERSRTRSQLIDLPDWQLRDLGLSREQVIEESRKAFWED